MPVVAGERETKLQILLYSLVLAPLGMAPTFIGMSSWFYGSFSGVLGLIFVGFALAIYREQGDRYARRTFAFSILYLFLLFAALIADKAVGLAG